jgi:hypothetical protein
MRLGTSGDVGSAPLRDFRCRRPPGHLPRPREKREHAELLIEPAIVGHGGWRLSRSEISSADFVLRIGLRNTGDRPAGEVLVNVVAPAFLRDPAWSSESGLPKADKPAHDTSEMLTDQSRRSTWSTSRWRSRGRRGWGHPPAERKRPRRDGTTHASDDHPAPRMAGVGRVAPPLLATLSRHLRRGSLLRAPVSRRDRRGAAARPAAGSAGSASSHRMPRRR